MMLILVVLAVAGVSHLHSAEAGTIRIIETGSEYTSIQAAIDAAAHGQTVEVGPGTYREHINFRGRNVMVRSEDPDDPAVVAATVIDGGGGGSVVTFVSRETASAVLAGFTITGGSAVDGGGIHCRNTAATITGNVIEGNSAGRWGGGISALNARPTIVGNTIRGNTANEGGGIHVYNQTPEIRGNVISGNSASSNGGGIYLISSDATIENCTISDNSAARGGGVYLRMSSPTVTNTVIAFSSAGAGIHNTLSGNPSVTYSNVYGNVAGEYIGMTDPTGDSGNISKDPLFAGGGDYHLQSTGGRWDPGARAWVIDDLHSPCIAAGDPASDYSNEPEPNGDCINMGAYGGTWQASMAAVSAPPLLSLDSPSPAILWPANGRVIPVSISGSVVDQGGGVGEAWLQVEDDYGELDGKHDITGSLGEDGSFSVVLDLIASRRGNDRSGRSYEISLHATSRAGMEADPVSVIVLVPHNRGR